MRICVCLIVCLFLCYLFTLILLVVATCGGCPLWMVVHGCMEQWADRTSVWLVSLLSSAFTASYIAILSILVYVAKIRM